jgi:hypothetical protein
VEDIGKILPVILKGQIRRQNPPVVEILAPLWRRVAGQAIARNSRPVAFHAGTLTLACDCASWSAQLQQMAEEIRAEINSFLGGPVVKKLQVRCVAQLDAARRPEPQREPSPAPQSDSAGRTGIAESESTRRVERPYRKNPARAGKRVHGWP